MLNQTGAAKFLLGDIILVCRMPPRSYLIDYRIYVPGWDTSTGLSWDVGDTQVLAGAKNGVVSGAVAIPASGTTFTLTATASTASFTATNGLLMVGNGIIVNYESLSGSTFVNCRTNSPSGVIPDQAIIQQCGNTAAYQAVALTGRSSVAGVITPDYNNTAANTFVTSTAVQNGTPALFGNAINTAPAAAVTNVNPFYFTMRFHAAITTLAASPLVCSGWVGYFMTGVSS
jgi:hypothetical protein